MLIGLAIGDATSTSDRDTDILRQLGCERIFSPAQDVFAVDHVIPYLRRGDILVVSALLRLGSNFEEVIQTMDRLHSEGIAVQVAGTDIVPGTALGDSFAKACAILAEFSRAHPRDPARAKMRSRGRPIALPPDAQARAERLLKGGQTPVAEIARLLNVSPATVYRYFPRGRRRAADMNKKNEEVKERGAGRAREGPPRKR